MVPLDDQSGPLVDSQPDQVRMFVQYAQQSLLPVAAEEMLIDDRPGSEG